MLIVALVGCFLAVGAFAAITATVIVDDESGSSRVMHLSSSSPEFGPGMQMPGPGRGAMPGMGMGRGLQQPRLRSCLEQHGALPAQGSASDLQKMHDAMRDCLGAMPGTR